MERRRLLGYVGAGIITLSGCLQGDYVAVEVTNYTEAQREGYLVVGGGHCPGDESVSDTRINTTDLVGICVDREFELRSGETVREPRVMNITDYQKSLVIAVYVDGYEPVRYPFHVGPGSPVTFEVRIETDGIEIHRL